MQDAAMSHRGFEELRANIEEFVRGKSEVIRLALVCLLAGLRDPGGAQPRAEAPRQDQRQVERHELSQRPTESVWRGYAEEWDRSLRAANKPLTTRCNYELAVTQLAEFLGGDDLTAFLASSGLVVDDASDAAEDPTDVARGHVEVFLAWMIETRSASTALNKYKASASPALAAVSAATCRQRVSHSSTSPSHART